MKVRKITKALRWRAVLRLTINAVPKVVLARGGWLRMRSDA
jgi:hypothetical protein